MTPWWLPGRGPVTLRLLPATATTTDGDARLVLPARFQLALGARSSPEPIAELRLDTRLALDDRASRTSPRRCGRRLIPLGLRNGIRFAVYPMSQLARRLRRG